MIFVARCQSFKILLMMFILVGSTFVANCQAERNPISLDSQSFCQDFIGADEIRHIETLKQDRQRNEQLWSDVKLFAKEQAAAAQQTWASSDLNKWWNQRSGLDVSPVQQPAKVTKAGTISVTAMMINYAANMNAVQWWQASNLVTGLLDGGHQIVQATSKLEADLQARVLQLIESTSNNIVQLAKSPQVSGALQVFSVVANLRSPVADSLDTDSVNVTASKEESIATSISTDENPVADPYWQYYTDCDFWGAQFEANTDSK